MLRQQFNWHGVLFLVGLLTLWEALPKLGLVSASFFPPISLVLTSLWKLVASMELVQEYSLTLWRAFGGYAIATLLGIGIGMAMGFFRPVYLLLEPVIEFVRPLPSVALIAVAILLLGIDDGMIVFVVAWACFFPIWHNTLEGVLSVDTSLLDTARTFRLSQRQTIFKIALPFALPYVLTGMRISIAFALILAVVSEMVASDKGVGRFIIDAQSGFRVPEMYAAVISLALVGYITNRIFMACENRALAWRQPSQQPQG